MSTLFWDIMTRIVLLVFGIVVGIVGLVSPDACFAGLKRMSKEM